MPHAFTLITNFLEAQQNLQLLTVITPRLAPSPCRLVRSVKNKSPAIHCYHTFVITPPLDWSVGGVISLQSLSSRPI